MEVMGTCPTCGIGMHDVLHASNQSWTLKCQDCDLVHNETPPSSRLAEVPVIISDMDQSRSARIDVPRVDDIHVDDEFEFEGHRMLVTAIESPAGRRVPKANAAEVHVLYAKVFDQVRVGYAVNDGDVTHSLQEWLEPEEEIHVGIVRLVDGHLVLPKTIKSDMNRTLHKGYLLARNIRRVFCDPAPKGAREGDKVGVRRRGKDAGDRSSPRGKPSRRGPGSRRP